MQQNKSMAEGREQKERSAAGGFLVFLSCEGEAVLKATGESTRALRWHCSRGPRSQPPPRVQSI